MNHRVNIESQSSENREEIKIRKSTEANMWDQLKKTKKKKRVNKTWETVGSYQERDNVRIRYQTLNIQYFRLDRSSERIEVRFDARYHKSCLATFATHYGIKFQRPGWKIQKTDIF